MQNSPGDNGIAAQYLSLIYIKTKSASHTAEKLNSCYVRCYETMNERNLWGSLSFKKFELSSW